MTRSLKLVAISCRSEYSPLPEVLSARFDYLLAKPFEPHYLKELLEAHGQLKSSPSGPPDWN